MDVRRIRPPQARTVTPRAGPGVCGGCGRALAAASGFILGGGRRCVWCAVRYRPMLRRSVLTALVVGTVLVAINQGATLSAGELRPALLWQVPLTYLVPFFVASWGALSNSKGG